jgi:hypothetical protein
LHLEIFWEEFFMVSVRQFKGEVRVRISSGCGDLAFFPSPFALAIREPATPPGPSGSTGGMARHMIREDRAARHNHLF